MIRFDIVTVFPEIIESYCSASIIGRAQKLEKVSIVAHDLRNWATDKHRTVDDRVFGGGPGMLMKVAPLHSAIDQLREIAVKDGFIPHVLATVASGALFTQKKAEQLGSPRTNTAYIVLCGHYEGFDTRIFDFVDESFSVGPYILTGGELPTLILVDAVTRLIPGVLGNDLSATDETTFSFKNGSLQVSGEHPQYTSPAEFTWTDKAGKQVTQSVPKILLSGHHKKIQAENKSQRVEKAFLSE